MKTIKLTQGKQAIVDDVFFESLNKYKWCAHNDGHNFYAMRNLPLKDGKQKTIYMHHCIVGFSLDRKKMIDHISRDSLDNRVVNLRIVTNRENCLNTNKVNTSKYVGVYWHKKAEKWAALIRINGKCKHLGVFNNEKKARDAVAEAKHYF